MSTQRYDPLDLLERLVEVPSPSGEEGPYAQLLAEELTRRGFEVSLPEAAPGRPNVLALPPGQPQPPVVFCTHIDVVPPHIPPRREGDTLHGRGAADTKGPLVAMLLAMEILRGEDIAAGFLGVVGEEVDHVGALVAARDLDLGQPRIILGEPTSNRVVAAQKGLLKVRLVAEGVAGHSAFPARGVSAIHRLLDCLAAIRTEPWPSHAELGKTQLNVGLIEGGVAANVFAPAASAQVLFRLAAPALEVLERVQALTPEGVRVEVISRNDPVVLDPPPGVETCVIPFNSDASYLASLGSVWLGGPGAIELAHSDQEHITREDLLGGVELYARLARAAVGG